MFLASFLIGLREGLEAALIIGILLAYVTKLSRVDVKRKIWLGVWIAVGLCLVLGAIFTFGRYGLSFEAQEIIGGSMSLLAVAMITWMVFWMMQVGSKLKSELQSGVDQALAIGTGWAIFWFSFVTVAREGLETTLLLWGWAGDLLAFAGAISGIVIAAVIGSLLNRGALRINLRLFFSWTGVFLVIVAAGVLAYGIHDLQEAAAIPGPFSGRPITPSDFRTGEVLTGFEGPFWMAAYPFGWAFDVEHLIAPSGALAAFLKGIFGFVPMMSWLEVTVWALYIGIVLPLFLRQVMLQARAAKARASRPAPASGSATVGDPAPASHLAAADHAPAHHAPTSPDPGKRVALPSIRSTSEE
ncbi:iron uptake transporter permease EfeU [Leucobacter sp. GX24907]